MADSTSATQVRITVPGGELSGLLRVTTASGTTLSPGSLTITRPTSTSIFRLVSGSFTSRAAATSLTTFPGPFENELLIAQPATVMLSTLAGQTMYRSQQALSSVAQLLPGLPTLKAGVYVLRLTTATGSTQRE
ncbi:T9SS type A sorting domain-containing protein [Hymenobacter endophyticus]|uniref:T9SS type A sorting domain-containing protein n=1 Tax=Hymenobacter endophyticus TaxID=3076335 RepID=A0ABU3TKA4_9BACT|nr:T9SS type A sorting domain-containing protein [Hymenobacter endophyticus]MDU0371798.1 T9SS type A sorting domain-containing protein [Hymenobacter endophyticus]